MTYLPSVTRWEKSGDWISFGDLSIFVSTKGTGKPILVLHGFPTSSYDFSQVAQYLLSDYQLIFFDYPGFGFSDKPKTTAYSLFRYADVAQSVVTHFDFDRILVLAHDIGDSIALELLRRNRPIIEKLVLLNGSVLSIPMKDQKMLIFQKLLLHPTSGSFISALGILGKPLFASIFQKMFFRQLSSDEIDAFWSLLKYNRGILNYHLLIRYMSERWEYQDMWLNALANHKAPLTLIWGQNDPVAPPEVADHIVTRRPDTTYIQLERVGHYPHWEVPDAVAAEVRRAFG